MSIEMIQTEEFNQGTQIKVIGVGGGGGNAVEHMIERNVQGVEFVCANTDAQALARSAAHRFIQLGQTGLGAGSKPEKGREAAESAEADIRAAIEGSHMLFITAGMGGGTGTGAAPVVAEVLSESDGFVVGIDGRALGEAVVLGRRPLARGRQDQPLCRSGRTGRDRRQCGARRAACPDPCCVTGGSRGCRPCCGAGLPHRNFGP